MDATQAPPNPDAPVPPNANPPVPWVRRVGMDVLRRMVEVCIVSIVCVGVGLVIVSLPWSFTQAAGTAVAGTVLVRSCQCRGV